MSHEQIQCTYSTVTWCHMSKYSALIVQSHDVTWLHSVCNAWLVDSICNIPLVTSLRLGLGENPPPGPMMDTPFSLSGSWVQENKKGKDKEREGGLSQTDRYRHETYNSHLACCRQEFVLEPVQSCSKALITVREAEQDTITVTSLYMQWEEEMQTSLAKSIICGL